MDARCFPLRFFLVAFAWSWAFWIPVSLAGALGFSRATIAAVSLPAIIVGAFGPLMGAIACVYATEGRKGLKPYLARFLDLRLGIAGWLTPVVVTGVITAVSWLLPVAFGEPLLPMLLPSAWVFFPYLRIMIFLGGGQEEFGWRGYALERMETCFGAWFGNLALGVIWACWHIPLWFIPGTSQQSMSFPGFILLTVGLSFFFSWVREASGYRPFSALWSHGLSNAFIPLMPVISPKSGAHQPRFWIWVSVPKSVG
jgi:CAAX protease family protein